MLKYSALNLLQKGGVYRLKAQADVQYNDFKGTAAADIADFTNLEEFLKTKGVDVNRYNPVGVDFFSSYDSCSYGVICKDKEANNKLVEIRFESKGSYEEFFSLFKRFNVILTNRGAYNDCEIDSNCIYVDDRN